MPIAEAALVSDRPRGIGLARCLTAVEPLMEEAKERVRRGASRLADEYAHVPFDPFTVDEILASPLPEELLMMTARVLVLELNVARLEGLLEGATPEERFEHFVSRLEQSEIRFQLFSEYPVLLEQLRNRLDLWVTFSLEFLQHLCEDWSALRETLLSGDPGLLKKIHGGAGDTHRHGRSVMIASFTGGATLVYKPRSLAVEEHFQQVLEWLNDHGAQPRFQLMNILNRGAHGWSEFIRSTGCTSDAEVQRFYQRQGGYLAVLYALNACDFHHENLIAGGEHPFLIDLEALFHRSPDDAIELSGSAAGAALAYSVLNVGLLPRRFGFTKDYDGVDLSGLSNPAGQLSPREVLRWERQDTDEMHLVRRRVQMPGSRNTPAIDGRQVSAFDYAGSIESGFRSTYRLLFQHRSAFGALLETFAEDEVRVIVRATQSYGTLLHESFHPDLLRDSADRVAHFQRLREGAAVRPFLDRLVSAECRDLLRGDIPFFTTHPSSLSLWTSDGELHENFFRYSAMDLVQRRLAEMSELDLERQV